MSDRKQQKVFDIKQARAKPPADAATPTRETSVVTVEVIKSTQWIKVPYTVTVTKHAPIKVPCTVTVTKHPPIKVRLVVREKSEESDQDEEAPSTGDLPAEGGD